MSNDRDSANLLKKAEKKIRRAIKKDRGDKKSFSIIINDGKHYHWSVSYKERRSSSSAGGKSISDRRAQHQMLSDLRNMLREVGLKDDHPNAYRAASFMMITPKWTSDETLVVPVSEIYPATESEQSEFIRSVLEKLAEDGHSQPYSRGEFWAAVNSEIESIGNQFAFDCYYEKFNAYPEEETKPEWSFEWDEKAKLQRGLLLYRLATQKLVPAAAMTQSERDKLWSEIMGMDNSVADFGAKIAIQKLEGGNWM